MVSFHFDLPFVVTPAKAGVHVMREGLDSRVGGNDDAEDLR